MIDFDARLKSLKNRRQGTREMALAKSLSFNESQRASFLALGMDLRDTEDFETITESAGVKYAIGGMAPVSAGYTRLSIAEGKRVADSLTQSLLSQGEPTTSALQGSVALDIHIKGHSDVDMLILCRDTVRIEVPRVNPSQYGPSQDSRDTVDIVKDIRSKSEKILPVNFWAADVDCNGSKSITISGGSLQRKVDIVPAIWYYSRAYQSSLNDYERGVSVYDKNMHQLIVNYPFRHIKLINDKNALYGGNLKSAVRLMKNMIADMSDDKKKVAKNLSSFDLAAIAYHIDKDLSTPPYLKLGLVEKIRGYLSILIILNDYRNSLFVPDGTRKIFDNVNKFDALKILSDDFEDLANSIFKELRPYGSNYEASALLDRKVMI